MSDNKVGNISHEVCLKKNPDFFPSQCKSRRPENVPNVKVKFHRLHLLTLY